MFKEYFTNYRSPSDMYKKLREAEGEWNEEQKVFNKMKKVVKNVSEKKNLNKEREVELVILIKDIAKQIMNIAKIITKKKKKKKIDIVGHILCFNQLEQKGQGLKILTPNQMLSRLPIYFAQLKAGNNSEKLKSEVRQLLYSLYRLRKFTKQLYKSLIDII